MENQIIVALSEAISTGRPSPLDGATQVVTLSKMVFFVWPQDNNNHTVVALNEITDGTSKTIAVGEVGQSANVSPSQTGRTYPIWAGGNNDWASNWRIALWARICGPTAFINNPDARNALNSLSWSDFSFGSRHPGGAQFVFADGSVRMIQETMSTTIYSDLASIADGNPSSVP